jgi:hypothetical protein
MPSLASSVRMTFSYIVGMAEIAIASLAWIYFSAASFIARMPSGAFSLSLVANAPYARNYLDVNTLRNK